MNTYVPSDHGQQSNTTERNAQPIQNSNQIKEKLKFSEQPRRKEEIKQKRIRQPQNRTAEHQKQNS